MPFLSGLSEESKNKLVTKTNQFRAAQGQFHNCARKSDRVYDYLSKTRQFTHGKKITEQ